MIWRHVLAIPRHPRVTALALLASALLSACGHAPVAVVALPVSAWQEEGDAAYAVSPDGAWALLVRPSDVVLISLATGRRDTIAIGAAGLAAVRARLGPTESAWSALEPRPSMVPAGATLQRSADGRRLAFFLPGQDTVYAGPADTLQAYVLDGPVTGMGWVPRGDLLYVLVLHQEGSSTLDRVNVETGAVRPIRQRLDAPSGSGRIAVSPDARTLYLALVSDTAAGRGTDIYSLDLRSGRLRRVAATPGDDIFPIVAGGALYWTENDTTGHRKVLWRLPR